MAMLGSGVEYGLHCLLYLVAPPDGVAPSARELALLQGVSPSYVAKLFTQLEKAGLVVSGEGITGGYRLARDAGDITVLDVVDALEPGKELFHCREIRGKGALFEGSGPPAWATRGTCGIHAVMIEAERSMRQTLAGYTLASLGEGVACKAPPEFADRIETWFQTQAQARRRGRRAERS